MGRSRTSEKGESMEMFEAFKRIMICFTSKAGESYKTYENGTYYISGDNLHLTLPGHKKKMIFHIPNTYRIEIDQ
jgi:hypothetical protein